MKKGLGKNMESEILKKKTEKRLYKISQLQSALHNPGRCPYLFASSGHYMHLDGKGQKK